MRIKDKKKLRPTLTKEKNETKYLKN